MAKRTTHKDVEYAVDGADGTQRIFKKIKDAYLFAFDVALSKGSATVDVLVYSRDGARFYMGGAGPGLYDEDPDASVFERFEVRVNCLHRVA